MNDGVKLLLERIKTHPEEFVHSGSQLFGTNGRWQLLIGSYESYLKPEDRDALRDAMNEVMAEKFTEAVMKELMGAEDDDPLGKSQQAQNMRLGGLTQGAFTSHSAHQALHQQALLAQQSLQLRMPQTPITTGTVSVPLSSGTGVTLRGFGQEKWWSKWKKRLWN